MDQVRGKLKSERGTSILLAFLLMLICMMVGASVLMAAVSNAGKTNSNRTSHQAYLALSSALWLVIDDLTDNPYYGRYSLTETPVDPEESTLTQKIYTQADGVCGARLASVLQDDMDCLFADVMNRQQTKDPDSVYDVKQTSGLNTEHILTVEPSDEKHFGDFGTEVAVTVGQKDEKGILTLTARLVNAEGYEDYVIQAELTAALPAWRTPSEENQDADGILYKSGEMRWADPTITRIEEEESGS